MLVTESAQIPPRVRGLRFLGGRAVTLADARVNDAIPAVFDLDVSHEARERAPSVDAQFRAAQHVWIRHARPRLMLFRGRVSVDDDPAGEPSGPPQERAFDPRPVAP
jgi:hypothetical protein